ncbi:hypothetical protein GCM10027403_16350 [Arthrobacter tecti]
MAFSDLLQLRASGSFTNLPIPPVRRDAPTDYLLVWVVDGDISGEVGGVPFVASASEAVLLPPGVPHAYWAPSRGNWHWLWVHFDGAAASTFHEDFTRLDQPVVPLDIPFTYRRFISVLTHAQQSADPQKSPLVTGELLALLGTILGSGADSDGSRGTENADLEDLFAWIAENLDQPLTLKDMCSRATSSPANLHRRFVAAVGVSPKSYVSRIKLSTAADYLRLTSMSVSNVAAAVGFKDPLYFSRRFKAWSGLSPTEYRSPRPPA